MIIKHTKIVNYKNTKNTKIFVNYSHERIVWDFLVINEFVKVPLL